MRIVYILILLVALGWILYNWRKKADLKIPVTVAVGTLILNIFPAISYLLLLGALGWLGFSFYKKTDKKMPVIAAVAALVLVATMPSGGNSERSDNASSGNRVRISGKGSRPDFSSEAKIIAYFVAQYPNASYVGLGSTKRAIPYDGEEVEVFVVAIADIQTLGPGMAHFYAAKDGRIFRQLTSYENQELVRRIIAEERKGNNTASLRKIIYVLIN